MFSTALTMSAIIFIIIGLALLYSPLLALYQYDGLTLPLAVLLLCVGATFGVFINLLLAFVLWVLAWSISLAALSAERERTNEAILHELQEQNRLLRLRVNETKPN